MTLPSEYWQHRGAAERHLTEIETELEKLKRVGPLELPADQHRALYTLFSFHVHLARAHTAMATEIREEAYR